MPATRQYKKKFNNKRRFNKKRYAKKQYRPVNKKAQIARLMPIAEGRKSIMQSTSATSMGAEYTVMIPQSWEMFARSGAAEKLDPRQITNGTFSGNTLFMRYVNQQIKINFETIQHYPWPVELRAFWGWCKVPYTTPLRSTDDAVAFNAQGVMNDYNLTQFVQGVIEDIYKGFMPVNDPKKLKILGDKDFYIKGISNQQRNLPTSPPAEPPTPVVWRTLRREITLRPTWKPQRKYHMRPVQAATDAATKPDDFNFTSPPDGVYWTPNQENNDGVWVPFTCFRLKNVAEYGHDQTGALNPLAYPRFVQKNTSYFLDL